MRANYSLFLPAPVREFCSNKENDPNDVIHSGLLCDGAYHDVSSFRKIQLKRVPAFNS